MNLLKSDAVKPLLRYGKRVVIRDGSKLEGREGIVFRVKDGMVQVLLDREVFWLVAEDQLEEEIVCHVEPSPQSF